MGIPAQLKSKKVLLGLGAVVVIGVGFFVFQLMSSGGTEMDNPPRRSRSAPRASARKAPTSAPALKKEEPTKSPLFQALEELKDPFRKEDPRRAELEDKLNWTQKEVEYLKASLEEKKLRYEIKELEKSIGKTAGTGTPSNEVEVVPSSEKKGEAKSPKRVQIKAILIIDEEKSALLISGNKKSWVHQGEQFDGWEIKEIREESVVLFKEGKTCVFFFDRPGITKEGEL